MNLDPLITLVVSLGFSILFFSSGWHKVRAFAQFKLILADYQLLPGILVTPAAIIVVVGEFILAALWISVALTPTYAVPCSLASAGLLAGYAVAVAINLARGRVHISCGCGVPGASDSDQPLSTGILFRNGALVLFALVPAIPAMERSLYWFDYMAIIATLFTASVLYATTSQLLSHSAAMAAWRQNTALLNDGEDSE